MRKLLLFFPLIFIGCDYINVEVKLPKKPQIEEVTKVEVVPEIVEEFKSTDKSDLEILYKQYSGVAEYLTNAGREIDSTAKLLKVRQQFLSDYSYKSKGYKSVGNFLTKQGHDENKQIVLGTPGEKEISREQIIEDYRRVAESIRLASSNK
jgi:hypothetical protein